MKLILDMNEMRDEVRFSQLMVAKLLTSSLWQRLVAWDKFWQLLTTFVKLWQLLATCDNFCQLLAMFVNF